MSIEKDTILEKMGNAGIIYDSYVKRPVEFNIENFQPKTVKKIENIHINNKSYPINLDFYAQSRGSDLYFCQKCFEVYDSTTQYERHAIKCQEYILNKPAIYKDEQYVLYKVQGNEMLLSCQNICRLGRAFINNKTLYLDIGLYNFYILYDGTNFVGFFTEDSMSETFNISCILVLPDYQNMGFGSLLVDLSYILKAGTPEKPFSNEGRKLHFKYWTYKVYDFLKNNIERELSIQEISTDLKMNTNDVIIALELLGIEFYKKDTLFVKNNVFKPIRLADMTKFIK